MGFLYAVTKPVLGLLAGASLWSFQTAKEVEMELLHEARQEVERVERAQPPQADPEEEPAKEEE